MAVQGPQNIGTRLSAAPELGVQGDVFLLAASAGGAAQDLKAALVAAGAHLEGAVGLLISTPVGTGSQHSYLRTSTIGKGAALTGKGICIAETEALFIPMPNNDWAIENALTVSVAVFY